MPNPYTPPQAPIGGLFVAIEALQMVEAPPWAPSIYGVRYAIGSSVATVMALALAISFLTGRRRLRFIPLGLYALAAFGAWSGLGCGRLQVMVGLRSAFLLATTIALMTGRPSRVRLPVGAVFGAGALLIQALPLFR